MSIPLCIGHRGAKGYSPENTLPSFEHAIKLGCDWIELDVYSVEGELLVIHDNTVDRTTNGMGAVKELSLDYLRGLDAGDGAQVPLLKEVIDLVDRRVGINIELKGRDTAQLTSDLLHTCLDSGWRQEEFLLSSFNHHELALADSAFRKGALIDRTFKNQWDKAAELGAWSINFNRKNVTKALVTEAHEQGLKVLAYTVNEPDDIDQMLRFGVDGLFSDYPDRVRSKIDNLSNP
jgi:glycerophosphoryl diester phosphodiesterase